MTAPPTFQRRGLLAAAAAAAFAPAVSLGQGRGNARIPMVAQLFDTSQHEQDVAKDFVIGSRAAWQDIGSQGGLRGRPVQHVTIEVDGSSPDAVRQAWLALRDHPACVALSGTVSDPLASQLNALMRADGQGLAHVAPWLQNSSAEVDDRAFPIFAARQEQIGHALKSLTVMGVNEVGAIFASAREHDLYREDVARTAAGLKLKLATFRGSGDLTALGQRLGPASPALLLFVGGTPELVQFTQGLEKQARQRYVIALADVNLQTVQQMGGGKSTPIIATQAVPMVTASLPVVRRYREVMARLFDEPPVALSLAGFIAARYTYEVLAGIDGPITRASALAAFQRRSDVDVGGYRVSFNAQRRSATFVTQSMLTADGRVVG
ncbi:ABC transporter substrate-binding protein [Caenimonas sedimenti]|uniref:ABC transporter substrate-binding protein n=1 Tax=Caenimonas sedimenti TaxID=2596921 RepID=A0A562ZUG7_9BURK|nr:ABC transporter substrate-binding protein [Caenimonas sedimenti]TWO71978.1 ABC transporter substrate-binding protein [Caenimonas sedimenti]